jgi:hypothetical protein
VRGQRRCARTRAEGHASALLLLLSTSAASIAASARAIASARSQRRSHSIAGTVDMGSSVAMSTQDAFFDRIKIILEMRRDQFAVQ